MKSPNTQTHTTTRKKGKENDFERKERKQTQVIT